MIFNSSVTTNVESYRMCVLYCGNDAKVLYYLLKKDTDNRHRRAKKNVWKGQTECRVSNSRSHPIVYTFRAVTGQKKNKNCWFCCFVFQCVSASYSEATRVCHNQVPSTLFMCNVPPFRRFVKTMTGCLGDDLGVTYRTIFIFEYLLLGAAWKIRAAPKYSFFQGPGPTAT